MRGDCGRDSDAPELKRVARLLTGEPHAVLTRLLALLREQLATDVAFVAGVGPGGDAHVRLAVTRDGLVALDELPTQQVAELCRTVLAPGAVDHLCSHERPRALSQLTTFAAAALRTPTGEALGVIGTYATASEPTLNPAHRAVLAAIGEVAAPLVRGLHAPSLPRPRVAPDLSGIADVVISARDVEEMTRPLLDALHDLTGLASSYLTVIHEEDGVQEIRYSRNAREGFALPEGLLVPWADTLCKRALEEGRACTDDVPTVWSDSQAGADLGIQVYVSVPVELGDGRVWGTLCAADAVHVAGVDQHLPTMRLFARLIAAEVERSAALERERARAAEAREQANTDPLTGCASRRVVEPWLETQLMLLEDEEAVLLAYADVDGFKQINDLHGHAAGDAVLVEVARRLREVARPVDLVARLGGDEFVLAVRVPRRVADRFATRVVQALAFALPHAEQEIDVRVSVGCVVSQAHTPADLLSEADRAMYADKRASRAAVR